MTISDCLRSVMLFDVNPETPIWETVFITKQETIKMWHQIRGFDHNPIIGIGYSELPSKKMPDHVPVIVVRSQDMFPRWRLHEKN